MVTKISEHPASYDEEHKELSHKSSTSRGEKAFNWITYGGAAGIGTFALTIPVAYWAKYGGGAKYFAGATNYLTRKGLSTQVAEEMVNTSALMQGGNLMLIPVKMLEDNKPYLVDKLNDMLGDTSGSRSVDEDPKQSWGSIIKSRLVAWGAVFAGFRAGAMAFGGEKLEAFEQMFGKGVCKVMGKPTHIGGVETAHFRYGKIGALDVFATAAASILLFAGTRFFAQKNPHWQIEENNAQTPAAAQKETATQPSTLAQPESTHFRDSIGQPSKPIARPLAQQGYQQGISTQRQADDNASPVLSA